MKKKSEERNQEHTRENGGVIEKRGRRRGTRKKGEYSGEEQKNRENTMGEATEDSERMGGIRIASDAFGSMKIDPFS